LGIREIQISKYTNKYVGKWIFGADFQRYFYILYDQGNQTLGFAVSKKYKGEGKQSFFIVFMVLGISSFLLISCFWLVSTFSQRIQRINKRENSLLKYTQMVSFQDL